jgi:HAD superfamily hydrolase (TIGR01450 family)
VVTWALDLDGVLWRGDEPIAGAAEAVTRLRHSGQRVVLVTNNSALTLSDYQAKLERFGVSIQRDDLVTSAHVAAGMLVPGQRALVCAGPGVSEALLGRGVEGLPGDTTTSGSVDAVVVGWHREFDYQRLTVAMHTVRDGARLIGTNDDATYPLPGALLPGGGSILAAVAYASGVVPDVAGKPHRPMLEHLRATVGPIDVVVGDRPSTDGLLARGLGARFALVLSGVTSRRDLPVEPAPDEVADDLGGLVP